MCRLAGVVYNKTPIIRMTEHQVRGGPDHTGFWSDDLVALGHNRLSIVDLSPAGNQPMESDRWVLAYVGEIYNHMEVRQRIGPMHWPTHCDTYTLLMAIEHKGLSWTLDNIEGMFAFAAYNKIEKKIHLAVDPMGVKQMFYCYRENEFAFASSPAALTHVRDKWELSKSALIDYLQLGSTYEPLFEGMYKLPRGKVMTLDIESQMISVDHYYQPSLIFEGDPALRSIQSIRIADVPVYIFLSGGVDSTVVASQCQGANAIHLEGPEMKYAQLVAERYNNKLITVSPRDYNAEACLMDYVEQCGDCSGAAIIPYMVSNETSKVAKVAISANGADELFYGYNRMLERSSITQYNHIFRSGISGSWLPYTHYHHTSDLELDTYVQYDLNKTLDFASMCHGLEVRVPYLNKSVVEAAKSISYSEHTKGRRKAILKDFLQRQGFDKSFVDRPKLGFSLFSEPTGYEELKDKGVELLRSMDIDPDLRAGRDINYYRAAAACFYCWYQVWERVLQTRSV